MRKSTREAIISTPKFSVSRDVEAYFYHLLLLHMPHRDESELLDGYANSVEAFEAKKEQLQAILAELGPFRQFAQELDNAIQHIQMFSNQSVCEEFINQDLEIELPDETTDHTMTDQQFEEYQRLLNVDQRRLFNYITEQIRREIPDKNCSPLFLFVTGTAGSGKSFTLKLIVEQIRRGYRILDDQKTYVKVCAYTGVAALLIKGQTIHSVFKLPIQKSHKLPDFKKLSGIWLEQLRRAWQNIRFIIIDEVSMLPYELLHQINLRLQELKCSNQLFGGVNILLFGDLMQLPPVLGSPIFVQPEELEGMLHLFHQFSFCELKEVVRQQNDRTFVDLLNNLREGKLTSEQYELLVVKASNSRQEGKFAHGKAIRIMPTNKMVQSYNEMVMNSVEPSIQKINLQAQDRLLEKDMRLLNVSVENIIPSDINKTAGVPKSLTIYRGLRVMLRYNVDIRKGLVNGSMGVITEIEFSGWRKQQLFQNDIPRIKIDFDNNIGSHYIEPITVIFDARFGYGSVERRMLPMVPCYAVTVHKLQGSTIKTAVINLGDQYFAAGQKFVALSRCTSLDELEIDELHPRGLIEGNVCNEDSLEEMIRLRNLPPYDA